jgi:hypothetical protein
MKGKQAPPGPKEKSAKLCCGPEPTYPRDKLPRTLTKVRTEPREKNKEAECLSKNPEKTRQMGEEYNVLAHLRKIRALLSIFDALLSIFFHFYLFLHSISPNLLLNRLLKIF